MKLVRKFLKKLPKKYLITLKKIYYKRQIYAASFFSTEKEFEFISRFVEQGDRVIDIGANIGHYTLKLSELVGFEGRVLAFEPVPETFHILSSNVGAFPKQNVTLINGAVSSVVQETRFSTPNENLYQSHMSDSGDIGVMAFPLEFFIPDGWQLSFVKIDAEGCDEVIIESSLNTISLYRPVVMAEISREKGGRLVEKLKDYSLKALPGSHNIFMIPNEKMGVFDF